MIGGWRPGNLWHRFGPGRIARVRAELRALREQAGRQAAELAGLRRRVEELARQDPAKGPPVYDEDFLATWNKNVNFLEDERFRAAYDAGMQTGHNIGGGGDLHIRWRLHVLCWAATHAARLEGDFVECGVNTGIFSVTVMRYIEFQRLPKRFFLFDTYRGVPDHQYTAKEAGDGRRERYREYYGDCYELARKNFAPFPNAVLVRGEVPSTLTQVQTDKVAYFAIDMNIAYPEIEALRFFWGRLVRGAPIVFDDYAWGGHEEQRAGIDAFARAQGTEVLTLPTGQGLLLKP
jgi:O-methyltransferase